MKAIALYWLSLCLLTCAWATPTNPKASSSNSGNGNGTSPAPADPAASLPRQAAEACLAPPSQRRTSERIARCVYVRANTAATATGATRGNGIEGELEEERTAYEPEEVRARRAAQVMANEWQGWQAYEGETQGVQVDMNGLEAAGLPLPTFDQTQLMRRLELDNGPAPATTTTTLNDWWIMQGQTLPLLLGVLYFAFRAAYGQRSARQRGRQQSEEGKVRDGSRIR